MKLGSQPWRELIREAATELGVTVSDAALASFQLHARELITWNRKVNLTAITDPREVALKHFVDALSPIKHLDPGGSLLDIGSGGGFPGIPLKVLCPALEVTLVDASRKKTHFTRHVIRSLQLTGIVARHSRTVDLASLEPFRRAYDTVTSRAFASLSRFAEEALPFLAPGGRIIALKGNLESGELKGLDRFIQETKEGTGPRASDLLIQVIPYRLPILKDRRHLVVLTHEAGIRLTRFTGAGFNP